MFVTPGPAGLLPPAVKAEIVVPAGVVLLADLAPAKSATSVQEDPSQDSVLATNLLLIQNLGMDLLGLK